MTSPFLKFVLTKEVRHIFHIHQYFSEIMHFKNASWIMHKKTLQEFTTTNNVNLLWWQRQQESRAGLYPRLKSRSIGSLLFYLSPTPYITGAPLLLGWSKMYWNMYVLVVPPKLLLHVSSNSFRRNNSFIQIVAAKFQFLI